MSPNRRRTTVIILIVLTIVLGAVAVGISYYIQQNQSPNDSSAAQLTICSSSLSFNGCGGKTLGSICSPE